MSDPTVLPQSGRSDDRPLYVLQGTVNDDGSITNAAGVGNGTPYGIRDGENSLVLQVRGSFSGSIVPEATLDGENWHTVQAHNLKDGSTTQSITGPGLYAVNAADLEQFRARIDSLSSGDLAVLCRGSEV